MKTDTKKPGSGRLAVVTGASTGIGRELARELAENGFDLVIASDEESIDSVAVTLREATGVNIQSYCADLAKRKSVEALHKFILSQNRPVEALLLNAGVGVSGRFVDEVSLGEDLNLIALNIASVVHLAKLILPSMVKRRQGRVLITSSIAALMPGPFYATYAASKAFLLSFSEALFNELKDTGVTVTALMPGATETQFFKRAGMENTKVAESDKDSPALVAKQGYEAMMAGEDHVIAGSVANKVEGFMSHFMTEQMKANIQRVQVEPKNNH